MKKYFLLVLLLDICVFQLSAQYTPNFSIPVSINNVALKYPWVGGLNNPQFSAADLNNDGIKDLFIFDRVGEKIYTFINSGTPNTIDYTYSPQYEKNFPVLREWALMLDYNCDNAPDIFTYNGLGACMVYRGGFNVNNEITFTVGSPQLNFQLNSGAVNIPISAVDIPAFCDMDNDNDIDVLTWDNVNGNYLVYYQNLSQENLFGCDSLPVFKQLDECWGDFTEPGFHQSLDLHAPCPFPNQLLHQKNPTDFSRSNDNTRHFGNATLAFDNDGDGDKEIIIGNISFSGLTYCHNAGNGDTSDVDEQDTLFPFYSVHANINYWPAAFRLDVNNDGLQDILASPNSNPGAENFHNVWYYKNLGTVDTGMFYYQKDSLFTEDMIEVGEGALPVFFNANNDTLMDLIIGNHGYFQQGGTYKSCLSYFQNIGTTHTPSFKLITRDYMNLSSLNLTGLAPTFGDLDGDGDADMILGDDDGHVHFFRNIAAAGAAANFQLIAPANYFGIDVGANATPQIVDVDHDGLNDLLIGEQRGNINYYRNNGTASLADFTTATTNLFGGVQVRETGWLTGYSTPFLTRLHPTDSLTLFVGCERGFVFEFNNIENNLSGNFDLVDSTFSDVFTGARSSFCSAQMNGSGAKEIVIGNFRGGVTWYDSTIVGPNISIKIIPQQLNFEIYPNPSSQQITIDIGFDLKEATLIVEDILGREISSQIITSGKTVIDVSKLPSAIYLLKITNGKYEGVKKFVKI